LQLRGDALDLQQLYLNEADHNVQALTAIKVAEVPRADLQKIADERPNVLKAITIDNVIEASIEREWLLNIGRRTGRARIAHFLCEFAVRLASRSDLTDLTAVFLPLTQEQIGDATALTPVHVNRMLKSLEGDGLITRNRQTVVIVDWKAMVFAADFNPSYLHLSQAKYSAITTATKAP
jgi:CRP-like cAMP-binding protein